MLHVRYVNLLQYCIIYQNSFLYNLNLIIILLKDPDNPSSTKDYNTANWVGFKKATANLSLLNLLKGYICKF
jgi:hypothetical protein